MVVVISVSFPVYLTAFQSLPCALSNKLSCVLALPLLNPGAGRAGRGSWAWVSSPWGFSLPVCQTGRSPEFFFPASLKQPKYNIPLKHNSDADSSVAFYSKDFYLVFFRIHKVEINRNYIISSTDNIQIDSLNKSSSVFLFLLYSHDSVPEREW